MSDLRGVSHFFEDDEAITNNPQNTTTSGISDDSTLPPNQQVEQANDNALGFDENDRINQNQNQGREV